MKRNPIINDGLEKAIGTIIGTLKKGTHFTTQDITGKLKESYREEYKKNDKLFPLSIHFFNPTQVD